MGLFFPLPSPNCLGRLIPAFYSNYTQLRSARDSGVRYRSKARIDIPVIYTARVAIKLFYHRGWVFVNSPEKLVFLVRHANEARQRFA